MYAAEQCPQSTCAIVVASGSHLIPDGVNNMLETIVILLLVLWAIGLVSSYTMGGLIHILLVVAIVVVLLRVIQGRKI